jgi:hypothetical protein
MKKFYNIVGVLGEQKAKVKNPKIYNLLLYVSNSNFEILHEELTKSQAQFLFELVARVLKVVSGNKLPNGVIKPYILEDSELKDLLKETVQSAEFNHYSAKLSLTDFEEK